MRNPARSIIILVLFLGLLSACGQKGALFLPGDPSTLQSIPTAEQLRRAAQAAAEEQDEDDPDPDPVIIQK